MSPAPLLTNFCAQGLRKIQREVQSLFCNVLKLFECSILWENTHFWKKLNVGENSPSTESGFNLFPNIISQPKIRVKCKNCKP